MSALETRTFVPGFKHDIFISYAHANNESLMEDDEGWVTKFYENLTQFLTAELGRREYFSIWCDRDKLRGNDDFEAKLDMAFLNSAVLISICSQSYVESAWCRRELIAFSEHPEYSLKVGETYRTFRVNLGPIREIPEELEENVKEKLDPFIKRMLGYEFYETEDGVDLPFRRTKSDNDDQRYWKAMRRIARDIAQLLRQMKKMIPPPILSRHPIIIRPGKTVYLAETADDLEDQRNSVKSALEQHRQVKAALNEQGLRVLPEFPLSLGNPKLATELREAIRSADMTVHLIGSLPGKAPVGESLPLVQLQWELAGEVARERDIQRLAWIVDDLDINKVREQHRAFLQSLEDEHSDRSPGEILRIGIEELREILLRRLFPPVAPTDDPQVKEQEEIDRLVYLTYLPADRDGAVKIKEALRRERLDVKMFRYEDRDPQMLARIHNASLEKSDGVMIYYGTDSAWLDKLVDEARDTRKARAKKNPLKVVCICDGPPDSKPYEVEVEYERFIIANCRDGVESDDLKKFVELIKA